jgi:hypothetical protein
MKYEVVPQILHPKTPNSRSSSGIHLEIQQKYFSASNWRRGKKTMNLISIHLIYNLVMGRNIWQKKNNRRSVQKKK